MSTCSNDLSGPDLNVSRRADPNEVRVGSLIILFGPDTKNKSKPYHNPPPLFEKRMGRAGGLKGVKAAW